LTSFLAFGSNQFPALEGPYLGQTAPRDSAELFLDGVISKLDAPEMNSGFSPDGKEFYYCAQHRGDWAIFATREENGRWTEPAPLPFTAGYTDRDFTMSPDGQRIYFGSNRPRNAGGPKLERLDIVYTEKSPAGEWSEPVNVGPLINTDYGENYPCVAQNGNLYFFSCRDDGFGGCELYMAK
jgi:hypothetical protein